MTMRVVLSRHHTRPSALHAPLGLSYLMNASTRIAVTPQNISAKQTTKIGVPELFERVELEQTGFALQKQTNHMPKPNASTKCLQAYKAAAYPWLTSALAAIPEQAATQADKQSVITAAQSLAAGVDNRW